MGRELRNNNVDHAMNHNTDQQAWLKQQGTDQNANAHLRHKRQAGFSPVIACAVAYFGAAVFFTIGFNISALPKLPVPLIGTLLPKDLLNYWQENAVLPLLLWGLHYTKRFAEVLFVHKFQRKMSCVEAYGTSIYYWSFGVWVGWSMNFHLGYLTPHPGIFYPGLLLYVMGIAGNFYCHWRLREMRLQVSSNAVILPQGTFFNSVSCPNYTFELLTWLGFATCTFTLAAFVFLLASFIVMIIYATKKHNYYLKIFNGNDGGMSYPKHRKILIPFIY